MRGFFWAGRSNGAARVWSLEWQTVRTAKRCLK